MSVQVTHLTKAYGAQFAVNNITFSVGKGEILGFLGPNGAGKTTTMKMITGFLQPTTGEVNVCGIDAIENPLQTAEKIGYLPENNPLYLDMYVKEYLSFIAGLHKLSNLKERVDEMIEMTGLKSECHKQIRQLSKGYRQRVGLAQAMIHNPEVLILDEPTSGLDPNQLVDIRHLIKSLGKEKTVVFSTHIMQEVQALCDRVIIINNGILVADDPIERLARRITGQVQLHIIVDGPVTAEDFRSIPGVSQVDPGAKGQFLIICTADSDIRPNIFHTVVKKKSVLLEMSKESFGVEKVFQQLTSQ